MKLYSSTSCFVVLLSDGSSFLAVALTEELEALQFVVNNAARALNVRGNSVAGRLQDIPVRAQEITLHDVHHGVATALTVAQVNSRYEFRWHHHNFGRHDDYHGLVEDFAEHADAAVTLYSAKDIVNKVSLASSLY